MNINTAIKLFLGSLIIAYVSHGLYSFCKTEFYCQIENGFMFHYNWFLFFAFALPAGAFTNLCLASPADIERDEIGFIRYMLQPYSNEEYYANMDAMLNNDNTDDNRYNELMIMCAMDGQADYYFEDGTKGYKWVDHYGQVHVHYDYDEGNIRNMRQQEEYDAV